MAVAAWLIADANECRGFQLRLKARLISHAVHASNPNQEAHTRLFHPTPDHPTQWQIAPTETVRQSQINLPRLNWHDKEVGVNGRSVAVVYALTRDGYNLLCVPREKMQRYMMRSLRTNTRASSKVV